MRGDPPRRGRRPRGARASRPPRACCGGRPGRRRGESVCDQLSRGADPPRPVPADARAAMGSRRRNRRHDGRGPQGRRPPPGGGRRLRGIRGPRRAVALRLAGGGVVRGGRRLPDGVPDGLDPAHATGRDPTRVPGSRPCGGRRGRLRSRRRSLRARRRGRRHGRLGGEARRPPVSRGDPGGHLRPARRDRAGRRRLRPRRRAAPPRLDGLAATPRGRNRDRLRGRPVAAPRARAPRRAQHRGAGLLPGAIDEAATRRRARGCARAPRALAYGRVHPIVGATFPLAAAAEAHRLVEERRSTGKVVLVT